MDFLALLSLSPEQARVVGWWAIVLVIALDLLASSDNVPFNTPRDWLLYLTQWKSLGLWKREVREKVKIYGRRWARFIPFNYVPMTGAIVPFMFAVLIGHFFHPGLDPLIGPGGFTGMGISLAIGLAVSVLTYFKKLGMGRDIVFAVAAVGLVCGVLIWPVSG